MNARGLAARCRAVAALLAVLAPVPAVAQSAAIVATGSVRLQQVSNRATLEWSAGGQRGTDTSDAQVTTQHQASVALLSPISRSVAPGAQIVLAHVVRNLGTDSDLFAFRTSLRSGVGLFVVYIDTDGDGKLGPRDPPLSGPVALAPGQSASLLVVVTLPVDAVDGSVVTVDLQATSTADGAVIAIVSDALAVHATSVRVALSETVDRLAATPGDTLGYTLTYVNSGSDTSSAVTLSDLLSPGLVFVPGSLWSTTSTTTAPTNGGAGAVFRDSVGHESIVIPLGTLAPGARGTVSFRAEVRVGTSGLVANTATFSSSDTTIVSAPVTTSVGQGAVGLTIERLGSDNVPLAGEVRYQLRYVNTSNDKAAYGVTLVDTLPEPLRFVSADGLRATIGDSPFALTRTSTL